MKIAILSTIENYEWAGTEEVWAQFAQTALNQGHQVLVCAHWRVARSPQVAQLKPLGLQVLERRPFRPTKIYLLKERYWSDMEGINQFQPDLLLINGGSLFDLLNLPALKQFCGALRIPKVFFCHFVAEGLMPHDRDLVREFAATMQSWVFVSKHNKYLAERQLAYSFDQAQVIINGPKLDLDQPLCWPDSKTMQMACVARLETRWKGQDVLLEVLSQPQWRSRNWHLNLYGIGPDAEYITQLIQHYDLTQQVTCHGYVQDIQSVWRQNHLMVLASRGEGTPLAVLEAMICGRPTVTTDVGGNREILIHRETGFIAETATPYSLSHTLEKAWEERDRWLEIGKVAYQVAKQLIQENPAEKLLNYLMNL
ncbi:MAG: glycosyltransferase family 4 protein [Oscillatoriales cyanobacterium RM2_1_1]|nr:glycosyltransferase family 4 protein [Oscillatoriales cyanobacterium SM2_3_0]NJO46156.1 glycosyltransferase family 4 protein [Oscillatoriales cyanobacterium RM2_1_1]